jgi:hypothetical protein
MASRPRLFEMQRMGESQKRWHKLHITLTGATGSGAHEIHRDGTTTRMFSRESGFARKLKPMVAVARPKRNREIRSH